MAAYTEEAVVSPEVDGVMNQIGDLRNEVMMRIEGIENGLRGQIAALEMTIARQNDQQATLVSGMVCWGQTDQQSFGGHLIIVIVKNCN